MFDNLKQQPDDPIIELMMRAKTDPSPNVVDLSAGIYKNELGETPIMDAVRQAEPRRLVQEDTRTYQGILGDARFNERITKLVLGEDSVVVKDNRVTTLHTVAGSAAVLMAGQLIAHSQPNATVWAGKPTWANHYPLLKTAGVSISEYPYYDALNKNVDFSAMMDALSQLPKESVVLLHGCCHNPSGADLSNEQWQLLSDMMLEKGLIPYIDVAYQGFGTGLDADAFGWRLMANTQPQVIISYSCSKNFAVYRDRIGALLVISKDTKAAEVTRSNILKISRATYSMPAAHGAFLVAEILSDEILYKNWESELNLMRNRINQMRSQLVLALSKRGYADLFRFVGQQFGMFSFLGLTKGQVIQLRDNHSVYMLESSRISIAGLTPKNIDYLADSVVAVLK